MMLFPGTKIEQRCKKDRIKWGEAIGMLQNALLPYPLGVRACCKTMKTQQSPALEECLWRLKLRVDVRFAISPS
jgi:hypothetical protein